MIGLSDLESGRFGIRLRAEAADSPADAIRLREIQGFIQIREPFVKKNRSGNMADPVICDHMECITQSPGGSNPNIWAL